MILVLRMTFIARMVVKIFFNKNYVQMKSLFATLLLVILFSCKESGVDLGKPSTFVRYFNGGTHDQSQAIIPTSDNGFVILANSGAALTSAYSLIKVIKVDAYGNLVWQSLIPGAPPSDNTNPAKNYRGFGITAISDNSGTDTGYLIVGDEINNGTQGLLMVQIDKDGNIVNTPVTKTSADIGMQVRGVAVTPSKTAGNFYVLGQAIVTNGPDMFLTEVNSSFTPLWTRTYGDASTTLVNKVFAFGDSIYWGGTRTASSSLMRWEKSFINSAAASNTTYPDGNATTASFTCNDICKFGFGYGFVGSYSKVAGEYSRIAFYRIDANGHFADSATYKLTYSQSFPSGNSITSTNDGGFLILGTVATDEQDSDANYYLIKTDSHGAEQWRKTYGGKFLDIGCKVLQAKDGGYMVLGTTTLANVQSIFLMKTDSQGEIQ